MQKFIVEGGHSLKGEFVPTGNKNEALPVIAACLLTDDPVILQNVPDIVDANIMLKVIADLGADVKKVDDNEYRIHAKNISGTEPDPALAARIRGSFLLAGPMLARMGEIRLPAPGGDKIGRRRLDTHIVALQKLGVQVELDKRVFTMRAKKLESVNLFLDEASVMATENVIMAAVLAKGTTVINNAASEPHVQGLCQMLCSMGAKISGIGSNVLTIMGVEELGGCQHTIGNDHIEIGSIIGLSAVTGSEVLIKDTNPKDLRMILNVFGRLGISVEIRATDIFVPANQSLEIDSDLGGAVPKIDDGPWPAFPADLTSIAVVCATQCKGTVLIFEKMFESRLFFTDHLITMGARIVLCDPHRVVVTGPTPLYGDLITSPDIRAGMALLIAALCAEGETTIQNVKQLDRGYEKIDIRLNAMGAKIKRVD